MLKKQAISFPVSPTGIAVDKTFMPHETPLMLSVLLLLHICINKRGSSESVSHCGGSVVLVRCLASRHSDIFLKNAEVKWFLKNFILKKQRIVGKNNVQSPVN